MLLADFMSVSYFLQSNALRLSLIKPNPLLKHWTLKMRRKNKTWQFHLKRSSSSRGYCMLYL